MHEYSVGIGGRRMEPNGSMPFEFAGIKGSVVGGPYLAKPKGMFGIKMAKEIDAPCDVNIPSEDFGTPNPEVFKAGLLLAAMGLHEYGEVYVGCMGGIGRTGTFMAGLAKVMGESDPVGYVRKTYLAHAVETQGQKDFINRLDVSTVKHIIAKLCPPKKTLWQRIKAVFVG